jgi:hypothetical protein
MGPAQAAKKTVVFYNNRIQNRRSFLIHSGRAPYQLSVAGSKSDPCQLEACAEILTHQCPVQTKAAPAFRTL